MGNSILDQAAKFIRNRRNNHRWLSIVLCLAIVVTVGTFYLLARQGHAMIHRDQVLECQVQIHVHDDSCYDAENHLICLYADYVVHMHNADCYDANGVLVCQLPEIEAHTHDDSCYQREQVLICGLEETAVHVHTEACYTREQGDMICGLEEHVHDASCYSVSEAPAAPEAPAEEGAEGEAPAAEAPVPAEPVLICGMTEHQHTDDCYTWNETLTCPIEEGTGHTHDESCYQTVETLICGKEEHILHTHDDSCYDENGFLICGTVELNEHMHTSDCFRTIELTGDEVAALNPEPTELPEETETTEAAEHEHDESCYDEDGNLICEFAPEEEPVHVHGESCYDEDGNLICGLEGHEHDESCYDEDGNLICEFAPEEEPVHVHGESCYDEDGNLICGLEGHEHDESCYDEDGNLICGFVEEKHIHSDRCYDRDGNLICGYAEHIHDENCYDEDGNLICGQVTERSHEHDVNCYDEDGNLICGYEDARDHEHDNRCYDEDGNLICGYEGMKDHVHSEDCYDEDGNLICGYEVRQDEDDEKEGSEYTRIFHGDGYTITAIFGEDAEIPEEAELIAEQITPDSDGEHYAQREAEYQEAVEDEEASMRALLKVGFYVDGEEIEPKSPVTLTIQFLDEDGLADGSPITVIHFADEGTEKLDGGRAENNSTTFQMGSFSEIAIGYGQGEPITVDDGSDSIYISRTFDYKDDAFQISFHIEGEATRADGEKFYNTDPKKEDGTESSEGSEDAGTAGGDETGEEPGDGEDVTLPEADQEPADDSVADGEESDAETQGPAEDDDAEEKNMAADMEQKLELEVKVLDPESEEYAAAREAYERKLDSLSRLMLVQVMSYSLSYDGELLDLSECRVTVKITAASAVKEYTVENTPDAVSYTIYANEDVPPVVKKEAGTEDEPEAQDESDEPAGQGDEESPVDEESDGISPQNDMTDTTDVTDPADADDSEEMTGREDDILDSDELMEDDILIMAMGVEAQPHTQIQTIDLDTIVMDADSSNTMQLDLNYNTFAVAVERATPNPKFTVQYYANLEVVAYNDPALRKVIGSTSYTNELPVIDTTGGKLPANGGGATASPNGNEIRNLYVDMTTGKVQTKMELTEVYSSRPFEYHKAPTINYINALVENSNYELKEVWVLKEGSEADSTERVDWDIHTYNADLHFTNRPVSAESGEYVLIRDGATLRLVYDTTDNDNEFEAAFYDYDIGDGLIYSTQLNAQKQTNGKPTSTQGSGTYHMHTNQSGINSPGNYTGSGAKLAFGNANTGSGLQHELWGGNLLNKANQTQSGHPSVTGSYKGCTFGLVTGLADGKIQYAGNVNAPNLFNDGGAAGKTSYDNGEFSLTFSRDGDSYTLTTVNGTGSSGLDTFNHPSPNASTVHNHIWTNNFWPMDSAASFGTDGHDMKFGDYTNRENYKFAGQAGSSGGSAAANGTFPWSDDGEDHNSYFGMHYNVEFDLVEDYVGPLEYYFFGDDDMWVFLDGRLVCDIGGVHSSVGEYVNLWDYLEKGSEESAGKHTLSFFYTERGESGSTCWMQFTLPSVSSLTPETTDEDYGHLKVEKTVNKVNGSATENLDNGDEFSFTIHLTDANGKNLPDDYSYVKYDKDGNEIGSDLIIWDGGEFKLKNGEYVIIKFLPQGTKYEITEADVAMTVVDGVSQKSENGYITDIVIDDVTEDSRKDLENNRVAEGEIGKGKTHEVEYINKFKVYELPKTGGSDDATPYTMAGVFCILSGAGLMYRKKFRERRFKKAS